MEIPFKILYEISRPDRPARKSTRIYGRKIFDAHVHVIRRGPEHPSPKIPEIINELKKAGIKRAVIMPTPNDGRWNTHEEAVALRHKLALKAGGLIKEFCGGNYLTYWLNSAYEKDYTEEELNAKLTRLEADMSSNIYSGIGEIGLYHFIKWPGQDLISYPPDFKPFLRIMDCAARHSTWITLHAEPIDPKGRSYAESIFGGIDLLFRRNPDLKLILAHTGMTNPQNARILLQRFPNLMMDIKTWKPEIRASKNPAYRQAKNERGDRYDWKYQRKRILWNNLEPVINRSGELYTDWAELFEELPERFLIGSDARFGHPGWDFSEYREIVRNTRKILGSMNPDAARMIASENAVKILKHP